MRMLKAASFLGIAIGLTVALGAPAAAAQFTGAGTGAIPDGGSGPRAFGSPLNVTFNVSGLASNVTSVGVRFQGSHPFLGDVEVVLIAPGGSPSLTVFANTMQCASGCPNNGGSAAVLAAGGNYDFADGQSQNWWTVAGPLGAAAPMPFGGYRTTVDGGPSVPSPPAAVTSLNTAFGGLTPAQANGTWTLRFRDGWTGDTGSITSATLFVNEALPVELQSFSAE